jgi:hypothetical protein
MRHGAEPWEELAVKLMLEWLNLYYSTSAFAPRRAPPSIIDYTTRKAPKGRDATTTLPVSTARENWLWRNCDDRCPIRQRRHIVYASHLFILVTLSNIFRWRPGWRTPPKGTPRAAQSACDMNIPVTCTTGHNSIFLVHEQHV